MVQKGFLITSCPRGISSSNEWAHPSHTQSLTPHNPPERGPLGLFCWPPRSPQHLYSNLLRLKKKRRRIHSTEESVPCDASFLSNANQTFSTGKVEVGGWEKLLCHLVTVITEFQSQNGRNLSSNQHSSDSKLITSWGCLSWTTLILMSN